jgi:hypothetical protein
MRTCTKCGVAKPEGDFYRRSRPYRHRLQAECKVCTRARTHDRFYSEKHDGINAKGRVYGAKRRVQFKEAVFAFYGGYVCACCGDTDRDFMTLDHIANDGAAFRREHFGQQGRGGGALTYAWLVQHGFPSGYQVLCANCQFGKRMNHGVCPHQTRCNDQAKAVASSDAKRSAPDIRLVSGEDMVCSADESRSSRKADVA